MQHLLDTLTLMLPLRFPSVPEFGHGLGHGLSRTISPQDRHDKKINRCE